jgi:lysophospholipase L1-like esterase
MPCVSRTMFFRRQTVSLVVLPLLSFLSLCLSGACFAQEAKPPVAAPNAAPAVPAADRWEAAIAKFEEADKKNPPPKGAVLFVGSSSIVRWKTLAKDFPDSVTLNRGFGGSGIPDLLKYMDRMVIPYAPKHIVFYSGENDIAAKGASHRTPEQVFADFKTFVERMRAALPKETRLTYIAMKPSPSRWKMKEDIQKANGLIRNYLGSGAAGRAGYVDVWPAMLGANGEPKPELFVKDRLHMSDAGYRIWVRLLEPVLKAE